MVDDHQRGTSLPQLTNRIADWRGITRRVLLNACGLHHRTEAVDDHQRKLMLLDLLPHVLQASTREVVNVAGIDITKEIDCVCIQRLA